MSSHDTNSGHVLQGPGIYRIRVHGRLDPGWSDRLCDMVITTTGGGQVEDLTTIEGRLEDQAALNGILNSLYGLHLPVLSVERLGGTN